MRRRLLIVLGVVVATLVMYVASFHALQVCVGDSSLIVLGPPGRLMVTRLPDVISMGQSKNVVERLIERLYWPLARVEAAISRRALTAADPAWQVVQDVLAVHASAEEEQARYGMAVADIRTLPPGPPLRFTPVSVLAVQIDHAPVWTVKTFSPWGSFMEYRDDGREVYLNDLAGTTQRMNAHLTLSTDPAAPAKP